MNSFEVILMAGIPASGKTTFCREWFFPSYIYISLDQLRTRSAENELFEFCLRRHKRCVIDNTNVNEMERARYIPSARAAGARVIGFCFKPDLKSCVERNASRTGRACVPDFAIKARLSKWTMPSFAEGFDELYAVSIEDGEFKTRRIDDAQEQPR